MSRRSDTSRRYRVSDYQIRQACHAAPTRVATLMILQVAYLTRRYGNATPSRAGLAARFGCCERTITRNVRALEAAGVLRVVRDPPRRLDDGTYTRARTNLYRIIPPPAARNPWSDRRDTPVTSKPPSGCNSTAPRAIAPVDNAPDPPPPTGDVWHPRLAGLNWRDLVVVE